MIRLLVFGTGGECARVVGEAERSGEFEVVGFVAIDESSTASFLDRPVFNTGRAAEKFSRNEVLAFACGDNRFLNQDRFGAFISAKKAGYRIASIVSASASIASDVRLRENVFVDSHVRVLHGAQLGENTWVMQGALIGSRARLGRSCWVSEGAIVESGAILEKNCTLTQHVVIRPGVNLKAWSLVNVPQVIERTPESAIFVDPLFPGEVVLRRPSGA